jgi:hypothetical protein
MPFLIGRFWCKAAARQAYNLNVAGSNAFSATRLEGRLMATSEGEGRAKAAAKETKTDGPSICIFSW